MVSNLDHTTLKVWRLPFAIVRSRTSPLRPRSFILLASAMHHYIIWQWEFATSPESIVAHQPTPFFYFVASFYDRDVSFLASQLVPLDLPRIELGLPCFPLWALTRSLPLADKPIWLFFKSHLVHTGYRWPVRYDHFRACWSLTIKIAAKPS